MALQALEITFKMLSEAFRAGIKMPYIALMGSNKAI